MAISSLVCCTVCVLLSLLTGLSTAVGATRGIWISPGEVMTLPMSGGAWNNVRNAAYGSWGTPNLANQDLVHSAYCVAGALVWARAGDPVLRVKVRDAIIAAKRTMDEASEYDCCGSGTQEQNTRTLALGRQIAGYAIAADLIDLPAFDATIDAEFRGWLTTIRTQELPQSNAVHGKSITNNHESSSANWGAFCGASRLAASLYLGDTADVARIWLVFQAFTDRSKYPTDAWVPAGYADENYFTRASGFWFPNWICDDVASPASEWTAINHPAPCLRDGSNIDGANVMDIGRSGAFAWPPGSTAMMYSWEGLSAMVLQTEMFHRIGYPAYELSGQFLRREFDFMLRVGWGLTTWPVFQYLPWIANYRYGTSYPTVVGVQASRNMSWTDWTHASPGLPVDPNAPAQITDLTSGGS